MYSHIITFCHTCTVMLFQTPIHIQFCYSVLPYLYSPVIPSCQTCKVLSFHPAIHVQFCYSVLPYMYIPAIPSRHTCTIPQLVTSFLLLLCQLVSGAPFLFDPFLLEDLFLHGGGGIGIGLAGKSTELLNSLSM